VSEINVVGFQHLAGAVSCTASMMNTEYKRVYQNGCRGRNCQQGM